MVECLPSIQDVLGFILALPKTGLGDTSLEYHIPRRQKEEGLEVQVILVLKKKNTTLEVFETLFLKQLAKKLILLLFDAWLHQPFPRRFSL